MGWPNTTTASIMYHFDNVDTMTTDPAIVQHQKNKACLPACLPARPDQREASTTLTYPYGLELRMTTR